MDVVRVVRYNETYDKIACDPGVAQEISDYFTFMVPGAKFMPAYKNKVWDGKIRIFNMLHALLYCGLRPKLEEFCRERSYLIEYDFDSRAVNANGRGSFLERYIHGEHGLALQGTKPGMPPGPMEDGGERLLAPVAQARLG